MKKRQRTFSIFSAKSMVEKKILITFSFAFFSILSGANSAYCEKIIFRADSMSGKTGSKNETTTLNGNAYVKTATMEINADSIILSGENFRYIEANGMVDGKNTESGLDFTCGNMKYDRTTKIARLENSVKMTDTANGVKSDAQIIEYDQNTEIATMQINVSIKQKDNTCTAAFAVYRKGKQMLELAGNPKIVQGEDSFRAQEITLNLQTQEIRLDGRVSGKVTDSKKTEDQAEKTPSETGNSKDEAPQKKTNENNFEQVKISENENSAAQNAAASGEENEQ